MSAAKTLAVAKTLKDLQAAKVAPEVLHAMLNGLVVNKTAGIYQDGMLLVGGRLRSLPVIKELSLPGGPLVEPAPAPAPAPEEAPEE